VHIERDLLRVVLELGILLLLYAAGLELDLPRARKADWRLVLGYGAPRR